MSGISRFIIHTFAQKRMDKRLKAFEELLNIMDTLRSECPWDRKQTFETLRHLTIEETFELSDAIMDKDFDEIRKELGDLMLHIVFYSKLGQEQQKFDITDVLKGINEKLVHRHPHIYGDVNVENAEDVANNWEKIKMKEGRKSVLEGVPRSLPAMVKAYRVQEKVKSVGFDWETKEQVWEKVMEETKELMDELDTGADHQKVEQEFGDLIFSLINYARFIGVNPEDALERTNKKFIKRFMFLEKRAKEVGKELTDMSLDEMDGYWEEAKKED